MTEEVHQLGGTENRFLLKMMQKARALGVSSEVGGGVYIFQPRLIGNTCLNHIFSCQWDWPNH